MAKEKRFSISIPEFRHLLRVAFILLKEVSDIEKDGSATDFQRKKEELLAIHSAVSNPELVQQIQTKLKKIKKKRVSLRKQKTHFAENKEKLEQLRIEQHEKIDRWLNSITKKELQIKKDNEIKKEADNILGEVKRKIYEGKHNLDRLSALGKVRLARKGSSLGKGLFVPAKYDALFLDKVASLKATLEKQLKDYEAEEKALSVMLETEQVGQQEEEKTRKIKKLKQLQEAKQENILQCLFGSTDVPSPSDPKYFYWKHYSSGSENVECLLKIRYQWDSFLVPLNCPEGSSIPQQWVVSDVPSSKTWASTLNT